MSKNDYIDEEDADNSNNNINECFYDSLDRIASSSASCSCSNSEDENDVVSDEFFPPPKFNYDVWISEPASVSERRNRLLSDMGLAGDPALLRSTEDVDVGRTRFGRSVSEPDHSSDQGQGRGIFRSRSDGDAGGSNSEAAVVVSASDRSRFDSEISVCCDSVVSIDCSGSFVDSDGKSKVKSSDLVKSFSGNANGDNGSLSYNNSGLVNKPPTGKNYRRVDGVGCDLVELSVDRSGSLVDRDGTDGDEVSVEEVCKIKNLDNGKEFVVNEIREDGMWNKLKEVGTGKQLTMEEFELTVGHSPIVQELMRRQNVEDGIRDCNDLDENVVGGGGPKPKKKGGWFKSIRTVASLMTGHKERRSSDEKDSSSEKGGRRSSSATDDSQDVSFHGPERIKVRQYGKSCKELSAMYKSQEIQAHKGSIWTIKFSLDGRYLASAGEDCVIHIWQVVESERKGDILMDKPEEGNLNTMLLAIDSPERSSLSPNVDNHIEKKRRGRTSLSRKSVSLDHIVMPETIFAITEKPICSFNGHLDDVLDLSWSKSQHLLSSSMDKTVRLWHLSSKSCLKVFSHSDYVTCIQFNPADDRYFISGSLDAKVRIWSIPDRQVVDWIDVHEMVTAACYTPDGQGALVGSHKGSCRLYSTAENKLQQKSQINLQNKKKSIQKKITGFQFVPGSMSELLITSADSRIRVVDGVDLVHKFKGFRNTNSQISACLTANVKYVVAASEDSHVYVWKNEADSQPSRSKGVMVTCSYEYFHCQDVSVAIPWPGMGDAWGVQDTFAGQHGLDSNLDEVSTINHPPTPVESGGNDGLLFASGCGGSPLHGTISSATNNYFFDRIAATWPEEKLRLAPRSQSPRVSMDFANGASDNMSAWGTVIVTAGLRGEIRTFQNFGLPVRI